jgi:hypothetical protein
MLGEDMKDWKEISSELGVRRYDEDENNRVTRF